MRFKINITGTPGCYVASGSINVPATDNPVRAAAIALLARGASPHDMLGGTFSDCGIIAPMSLLSLTRPRQRTRVDHRAQREMDCAVPFERHEYL